eukprot:jgi/Ulvmu1/10675/UM066_0059.1
MAGGVGGMRGARTEARGPTLPGPPPGSGGEGGGPGTQRRAGGGRAPMGPWQAGRTRRGMFALPPDVVGAPGGSSQGW